LFVNYRYLEQNRIVTNRMYLARAIEYYGFPKPIAFGANRLAWDLAEVEAWIASRPRRAAKTGAKKPKPAAAEASVTESD
jgi:predicted DNA-binding transcriptional regulator AlpA